MLVLLKQVLRAHLQAKRELLREIKQATSVQLSENVATLGFARRAAEYKRADFHFSDLNRLRVIQKTAGPFQVVFGARPTLGMKRVKLRYAKCLKPPLPCAM
jgi:starch phosphorylase